jgi:hypothetical protein
MSFASLVQEVMGTLLAQHRLHVKLFHSKFVYSALSVESCETRQSFHRAKVAGIIVLLTVDLHQVLGQKVCLEQAKHSLFHLLEP